MNVRNVAYVCFFLNNTNINFFKKKHKNKKKLNKRENFIVNYLLTIESNNKPNVKILI